MAASNDHLVVHAAPATKVQWDHLENLEQMARMAATETLASPVTPDRTLLPEPRPRRCHSVSPAHPEIQEMPDHPEAKATKDHPENLDPTPRVENEAHPDQKDRPDLLVLLASLDRKETLARTVCRKMWALRPETLEPMGKLAAKDLLAVLERTARTAPLETQDLLAMQETREPMVLLEPPATRAPMESVARPVRATTALHRARLLATRNRRDPCEQTIKALVAISICLLYRRNCCCIVSFLSL